MGLAGWKFASLQRGKVASRCQFAPGVEACGRHSGIVAQSKRSSNLDGGPFGEPEMAHVGRVCLGRAARVAPDAPVPKTVAVFATMLDALMIRSEECFAFFRVPGRQCATGNCGGQPSRPALGNRPAPRRVVQPATAQIPKGKQARIPMIPDTGDGQRKSRATPVTDAPAVRFRCSQHVEAAIPRRCSSVIRLTDPPVT